MPEKKEMISRKKISKGESYRCDTCGLVVTVDEGGREDAIFMCCDQPMEERKFKIKATK